MHNVGDICDFGCAFNELKTQAAFDSIFFGRFALEKCTNPLRCIGRHGLSLAWNAII